MKVTSVGAVIERDGKYLLMDRKYKPLGFASVAGHIEDGQTPEEAVVEEVIEETGMNVISVQKLFEEDVPFDHCWKHEGHYWYVFMVETEGDAQLCEDEHKSVDWYTVKQIKELSLDITWKHFFEKLKIL
jgi:8-oxo-dGTP pyrophosphatase MutT (NUDIX family)